MTVTVEMILLVAEQQRIKGATTAEKLLIRAAEALREGDLETAADEMFIANLESADGTYKRIGEMSMELDQQLYDQNDQTMKMLEEAYSLMTKEMKNGRWVLTREAARALLSTPEGIKLAGQLTDRLDLSEALPTREEIIEAVGDKTLEELLKGR